MSFRDIIHWLEVVPGKDISVPTDPALWALPASGLTAQQMELYCDFRGKRVVDTLVYDAASFFPTDMGKPTYIDRQFPPFPWSRRRLGHQLLTAQDDQSSFDKAICSDILTLECSQKMKTLQSSPFQRKSWTGMRELLGGHPEYLQNPVNPRYNLRASSFYLTTASPLHRLGRRAQWNGESFEAANVTFGKKAIFPKNRPSRWGFDVCSNDKKDYSGEDF